MIVEFNRLTLGLSLVTLGTSLNALTLFFPTASGAQGSRHLNRAQFEALCNPENHQGQAGVMVDRVLAARQGR